MHVIVARYYTKEGVEKEVLAHLKQMVALSRQEPGCRVYIVNQSVDDPRRLVLYEQYDDQDAFQAHLSQPYFNAIVREKVWPLIESREREVLRAIEPDRD